MKQTRLVLALAAFAGLAGCMDLEEHPITGVAADYYGTAAGANAATVGAYTRLKDFYGQESEILMTMVGTDSWERGEQLLGNGFWNDYTAQLSPSVGDPLLNRWQTYYQGVNAAMSAMFIADDPAMPAPTGESERVVSVRPFASKKRTRRATSGSVSVPSADGDSTSTRSPVSSETSTTRPSSRDSSRQWARRLIAAFNVTAG